MGSRRDARGPLPTLSHSRAAVQVFDEEAKHPGAGSALRVGEPIDPRDELPREPDTDRHTLRSALPFARPPRPQPHHAAPVSIQNGLAQGMACTPSRLAALETLDNQPAEDVGKGPVLRHGDLALEPGCERLRAPIQSSR